MQVSYLREKESLKQIVGTVISPTTTMFSNNLIILISAAFGWLQMNKRKQGQERVVNPPYMNMMRSLGSSLPLLLKKSFNLGCSVHIDWLHIDRPPAEAASAIDNQCHHTESSNSHRRLSCL